MKAMLVHIHVFILRWQKHCHAGLVRTERVARCLDLLPGWIAVLTTDRQVPLQLAMHRLFPDQNPASAESVLFQVGWNAVLQPRNDCRFRLVDLGSTAGFLSFPLELPLPQYCIHSNILP